MQHTTTARTTSPTTAPIDTNTITITEPRRGTLHAHLLRLADIGLVGRDGRQWRRMESDALVAYVLLQLAGLSGDELESHWATFVAVPLLGVLTAQPWN